MSLAFRAFMSELIDYAGLFPPARLDLDTAIRNFARYRDQDEAWMLGRFIIPAGQLAQLAPYVAGLSAGGDVPLRLTVLAAGGATVEVSLATLDEQIAAMDAFVTASGGSARVEVIETRLPDDVTAAMDAPVVSAYLNTLCARLAESGLGASGMADLALYVEAPAPGDLHGAEERESDRAAVAGIANCACESGLVSRIGYKLRCGGVTADTFPSPARVAAALIACRDHGVALKCTAGLHHPVRHQASEPDVMMHGFLNVFGAGLLAFASGASEEEVLACVADTEAKSFAFAGDAFTWRDRQVSVDQIQKYRDATLAGFGSCSFTEPREDLRALGMGLELGQRK